MAEHTAQIQWNRGEEAFLDKKYSRRHTWHFDGGATVVASSAPTTVPIPMSDPSGVDPEEALVAALSSCHMLWFLALAAKNQCRVDRYEDDAVGKMGTNPEGKTALITITLRPKITFSGDRLPDAQMIQDLHHQAHELCFIANSIRSEVIVHPVL